MQPAPGPTIPAPLDLAVFRRMADMSNEAFYLTDADGRFCYVNERAVSLTGYSRDELLGMTFFDLDPDYPPELFAAIIEATANGPVAPVEARTRRRDGVYVPTEASVARIDVAGVTYLFGVVRDISERRQMEAVQRTFARRMLENLETERQRVARELHDDVGQAVATVGVLLHTLAQTPGAVDERMRPALDDTLSTVGDVTESVARLCREYHPAELVGLGLEGTLRAYVREFGHRHGIACRLTVAALAAALGGEHDLHLYRIVQEALTNVARHARARRVTVKLVRRGDTLLLTVQDDGVGFDPDSMEPGGRLGLVTMRERAEIMGATLTILSRYRRGTEVRVSLPLTARREDASASA
jgi:PAS domain S-box-containing protein